MPLIMEGTRPINMEGTRPNAADYEGHPAPTGPALTNDLCGQNVKVNVNTIPVGATVPGRPPRFAVLADAEINTLTLKY